MWPVSAQFLAALTKPHRNVTIATYTPPGGTAVTLKLEQNSTNTINVDSTSNFRRSGSLTVLGSPDDYSSLSLPGGIFQISHGINFGATQELVPVFFGEMSDGSQTVGNGTISFGVKDNGNWIQRCDYLTPYSPAVGTARTTVIASVITDARPGTTVTVISTDVGTVQGASWPQARFDTIGDLTKDGATDAFFLPDGSFLVRDQLTLSSPPVWTISAGEGGALKAVDRARPMDKLYNTVVVRPSATDGTQAWTQQVVQITDPNHPRYPGKIGIVPYIWDSPTAATADAALGAATQILARVQGTTETLNLDALSNPALEAGDPIRVITPEVGQADAAIYQHYIDSFTLDLISGGMSMATRSQVVTDES